MNCEVIHSSNKFNKWTSCDLFNNIMWFNFILFLLIFSKIKIKLGKLPNIIEVIDNYKDNGQRTMNIYIYCYDLNLDPLCELWPHCTRAHTVTGMQPHSTQISITLSRPFDFFWERKERNTNKESFHYWKQTIMRCQCPTWSIMPHVLSLSLFFFQCMSSCHVLISNN